MNELNTLRFMRGGGQEYSGVLGEKKRGIVVVIERKGGGRI